MSWSVSVRTWDLKLTDPIAYDTLTLEENYNQPDMLSIEGDLDDIRAALPPGGGVVVEDETGAQRFAGILTEPERRGDETGTLVFSSDLVLLWDLYCWPTPTAAWTAQTSAYDTQTGSAEARILGYVARNGGSAAYNNLADDRRIRGLRLPASLNRGPSATTKARFQNLGQLVADLAELASLRVKIVQTYVGSTAYRDLVIESTPDLSAWAQFGTAGSSGPALLDPSWRYKTTPGVTVVLSAAGGNLENRALAQLRDATGEGTWRRRIESFLDQRGTDDATAIAEGMATAMQEGAGTVEIDAPLAESDLDIGTEVPVGALVTATLDGLVLKERIRQVSTTVSAGQGEETVAVVPKFGTAYKPVEQRAAAAALRRVSAIERSQ